MNRLAFVFVVIGLFVVCLGVLPFIFAYPYCVDCDYSGPGNFWQLILMVAYEGQIWYLAIGITLLSISGMFFLKR